VSLLQRQRLRNHANLSTAPWIQSLPEPALAAPISPQPLFAASGWAACLWFSNWRRVSHFCFDHEIHIPAVVVAARRRNTKD
jgi:hypothetical protein